MRIEDLVINGSGQEFKCNDFNELLGPGVYVIIDKGQPVYIGMAKNLLNRASGRHHKRHFFEDCDKLLLFPCVSYCAAKDLEAELIGKFRPLGNANKRFSSLAKRLGIARFIQA